MKKTCILFGAGAEINYGVKGGKDFALKVIGLDTKEMDETIKEFYSGLYEKINNKDWVKKIEIPSDITEQLVRSSLRKKYLSEEYIDGQKLTKTDLDIRINNELKNLSEEEKGDLFDKYVSYMDILDEKFHSLINPRYLGPQKFWTVVYCYTRAYLTILEDLLNISTMEEKLNYEDMLNNPKEVLEKIRAYLKIMENENSYYKIVKDYSEKHNLKIITTNYTPLCEIVTGIPEEDLVYIHGRLGLFEDPYSLKIYDIDKETLPENKIYFPYLFVQSGVKPIVDSYQIKAFSKMVDFLEECERLIIMGYEINIDDNHINGLIRNLCKNKEIIYFDFNNKNKEIIKKLLRLEDDNILRYIKIDDNNCCTKFKEILEEK